eukprot:Nk52_evm27s805 gene=Nk52_evmTU27s805
MKEESEHMEMDRAANDQVKQESARELGQQEIYALGDNYFGQCVASLPEIRENEHGSGGCCEESTGKRQLAETANEKRASEVPLVFREPACTVWPGADNGIGKIVNIVSGDHHTLLLTSKGTVYAQGNNRWGQLGVGNNKHCYRPTIIEALRGKLVVKVSAGSCHSAAITESGGLYVWGSNKYGNLGLGSVGDFYCQPTLCQDLDSHRAIDVCCGFGHTVVSCENGKVFGFGRNEEGECGVSRKGAVLVCSPVEIKELYKKNARLFCGRKHCLAICESTGEVYGWGNGKNGRFGVAWKMGKGMDFHHRPMLVWPSLGKSKEGEKVVEIDCGWVHTIMRTSFGRICFSGLNCNGQLGMSAVGGVVLRELDFKKALCERENINLSKACVIGVGAGSFHSAMVVTIEDEGSVTSYTYVFGCGVACGFPQEETHEEWVLVDTHKTSSLPLSPILSCGGVFTHIAWDTCL